MMPVPSHLRGLVLPKSPVVDEGPLDAFVSCSCGGRSFHLLFPRQTHLYNGEKIPCTAEIDGKFFFVLRAHCAACSREFLLFDADRHGWNGFVCHDAEQAALPRPPLEPWKCLACDHTEHEASIQIQTQGREDFVSEAGDDGDAERWPDGWLSMSIHCTYCGKATPEWVSYETM
jgi:hypothetical protein